MVAFTKNILKEIKAHHLLSLANELTYKLLFAFFPFVVFLISLIGFFNFNPAFILQHIGDSVPQEILNVITVFIGEVVLTKNVGLLSSSFVIAIFSASSGFLAAIRGINRANDCTESRNFVALRLLSIVLVLCFAASIILSIGVILFGDILFDFIKDAFQISADISILINIARYVVVSVMLLFFVLIIYKFAQNKNVAFKHLLPGASATVLLWVLASKILSLYMNNFSRYSYVYGSIGGVFALMIWLNIISFILILGAEINAHMPK